jgi:hypothetical protein
METGAWPVVVLVLLAVAVIRLRPLEMPLDAAEGYQP